MGNKEPWETEKYDIKRIYEQAHQVQEWTLLSSPQSCDPNLETRQRKVVDCGASSSGPWQSIETSATAARALGEHPFAQGYSRAG